MDRRRSLLVSLCIAAAACGGANPGSQQGSRTPRPLSLATSVTLDRAVVHHLDALAPAGTFDPAQPITVGVVLAHPNPAGEDAIVQALYDPTSAQYQQFLTPDEYASSFGVSAATFAAAESWLQSGGLAVTTVPGATDYLLGTGSAAQVQALFGVTLSWYQAAGRTFYANAAPPLVPASLPVFTVFGLNDLDRFRSFHVTPSTSVPVTGLLTPQNLWWLYDQPSNNFGNGQTMAIFGWGVTPNTVSNLRAFEQIYGLPQVPITINRYGDTSTPDTSDGADLEWDLDTQASTGMSPDVLGEKLYFGHHNTDADLLAALAAWVNDKQGPMQGSASFGECENVPQAEPVIGTDGLEDPGNQVLRQAVIEGRTLFVSTGDTGGSCPIIPVDTNGLSTQLYPALNYPAASPYAVAVGGTILNSDGGNPPQRLSETAWEFTGGGNSLFIPAGGYQQGVPAIAAHCAEDDQGNLFTPPGPLCRGIPDVAAMSGDAVTGNGLAIYSGGITQGAGTSLSAPLWNGMWTRVAAAAKGKRGMGLGFANYSLYTAGKRGGGDFFDIVVGNNQPYSALPGWDNVSGWGVPDVTAMMLDFDGRTSPVHNVAPPVPAAAPVAVSCGTLFTDPAGDDVYVVEGQTLGAQGTDPQLDILSGSMSLTPDGLTLRTRVVLRNLTTTIPTGGVENDYNFVWQFNGQEYFTQVAIEPGGLANFYDGQVLHVSLETRFQQLHVDSGSVTLGANGVVEVDVPLANIGAPALGQILSQPAATSYVREGALAGPLEPVDTTTPQDDFLLASVACP